MRLVAHGGVKATLPDVTRRAGALIPLASERASTRWDHRDRERPVANGPVESPMTASSLHHLVFWLAGPAIVPSMPSSSRPPDPDTSCHRAEPNAVRVSPSAEPAVEPARGSDAAARHARSSTLLDGLPITFA